MRNSLSVLIIFVLILGGAFITVYGEENQIYEMKIPDYKVSINGTEIDNIHSKYPVFVYKEVPYIPISASLASGLQLIGSSSTEEILIEKAEDAGSIAQDQSAWNDKEQIYYGTLPKSSVKINGKEVDNAAQAYPVLRYKEVPYVPLTWKYVVEEFHYTMEWSPVQGLSIMTEGYLKQQAPVQDMEVNGFYALSSYDQFNQLKQKNEIKKFDTLSFGWGQVGYNGETVHIQMEKNSFYYFYVPEGYEEVMTYLKQNQVKTYLNLYADQHYDQIFQQADTLIEEIDTVLNGKTLEYPGLEFDGVVIDFENLPTQYRETYVEFLKKLRLQLDQKKKGLNVAVQPRSAYAYGEIVKIADKVILMLHDYEAKTSTGIVPNEGMVDNPITPIEKLKRDLIIILNDIDSKADASKLQLQINFTVSQWRVQDGKVLNTMPYTPEYSALISRIHKEQAKGRDIKDIVQYSERYENPYVTYEENGVKNTIWYEDARSVKAKIDLVKELGLGGVSLWRIGSIPDGQADIYMDVWDQIK